MLTDPVWIQSKQKVASAQSYVMLRKNNKYFMTELPLDYQLKSGSTFEKPYYPFMKKVVDILLRYPRHVLFLEPDAVDAFECSGCGVRSSPPMTAPLETYISFMKKGPMAPFCFSR